MQFALNLKKLRLYNGYSFSQMSNLICISNETYRTYEEGMAEPCISILSKILAEFKISNVLSFLSDPGFDPRVDINGKLSLFESKYQNIPWLDINVQNIILSKNSPKEK